jgi:monofunctional biosynthetic peptidoglycan transglycosylase
MAEHDHPDQEPEPQPSAEAAPPPPEPLPTELPPPEPPPTAAPPAAPVTAARPRRRRSLLFQIVTWVVILAFVVPPLWVGIYRFVPPPVTPLMLIRLTEGQGLDYRWRPLSEISPALVQAAVAAEDARFCQHNGFDFQAMQKAMAHNQRRPGRVRGGSTISQQTAKNVFLWPARSYVRKAVESYFTVLIEALWGKRRIMETYLNVVEMGPGVYGADAAARHYFGTDAAHLSNLEASRLAAIFPNPLKWRAVGPGRYVQGRSRKIGGRMMTVRTDGLAMCVGKLSGYVPAAMPDLSAPPPKAAQAWVEKQQAAEAKEEDLTSALPASAGLSPPASEGAESLDGPPAPASDAAPSASAAEPPAQ